VIRANGKTAAADTISRLTNDPNRPTVLFNGMIDPLIHFRIKGVIWYQGEANAMDDRSTQYRRLFPALIEDWRSHWGYAVPFLFVQLAGYGHNKAEPAEYPWADLREAQSMTLSLPATGMATAIDIGDENDIHPKDKQDVAHRLVLAAVKAVYGDNIVYSGPTYQSMQIEGNRIRIKFSNIGSGLLIKDKYGYGRGFEIAAGDGKFRWAQAQKEGNDIVVCNDAVPQPVAVRYDWSNTPDGNVYNKEGLPALPFRTDRGWH
jgi:sialate O-acetylesterase